MLLNTHDVKMSLELRWSSPKCFELLPKSLHLRKFSIGVSSFAVTTIGSEIRYSAVYIYIQDLALCVDACD